MQGIDRKKLLSLLQNFDAALSEPMELCLIGAAPLILSGKPLRQTADVDVWAPASSINDVALHTAAAASGLDVDPQEDDPERPYLQIVRPGIVVLPPIRNGKWPGNEASCEIWKGRCLRVTHPPFGIVAAAKLVRATDVDIDDVLYLIGAKLTDERRIDRALAAFPEPQRRDAEENMTVLKIALESSGDRPRHRDRGEDL